MEFFYAEPRLVMPYYGRLLIRFFTYGGATLLVAIAFILSLSEKVLFRAIGILLLVFLAYYFSRFAKPRRSLQRVSDKYLNLALYLAPEAYKKLELALDRTVLDQSDFTLNLLAELLKKPQAQKAISDLDIPPAEFLAKVESRRVSLSRPQAKEEILPVISRLISAAFVRAQTEKAEAIGSRHLLGALLISGESAVVKILEIFGRQPSAMV